MDRYVRSFASPDEVIDLATVRSALITKGGLTVSYDVHQPGWRWSIHVRPLVKTEWCDVHHIGVVFRGWMHVVLENGTEFDAGPMSLVDIPAGHDAWVVGDEAIEMISWAGAKGWLAPLEILGERVLATLLFTDIVGSTATAVRVGHAGWMDLVANHEARSREIVERYRGRTVKSTGDGILATFDGAARALRCALALRDAGSDLGIESRLAVHTGEIDVAEDDIRGVAIHEASRMLSVAGPREIVLSDTTAGLVRDGGFELQDRGEHELRGIDGPRRIYALR
jgi:class 3 adenylate cyclase